MRCVAFKRLERGSLVGFADLAMDSGLVFRGCTYHRRDSKAWCSPPSRPRLEAERKPMLTEDGKIIYAPIVEFTERKICFRWSAEAVKAIEQHLSSKEPVQKAGSMNGDGRSPQGSNRSTTRDG